MSATVYVIEVGRFDGGDVSGYSMAESGEQLYSHMSSSPGWLVLDTTSNFGRKAELTERFGEFDVQYVGMDDPLPDAIAHHFKPQTEATQ